MKSLSIFKTKKQLAYDLIAMLNSRVDDSEKYLKIVNRLCRKYTRSELAVLWRKTASSRF